MGGGWPEQGPLTAGDITSDSVRLLLWGRQVGLQDEWGREGACKELLSGPNGNILLLYGLSITEALLQA